MPYKPHTLVVFGGPIYPDIGSSVVVDEWSCTLRGLQGAGVVEENSAGVDPQAAGGPLDDPAGYLNDIQTGLGTFFGSASNFMNPVAALGYVKANSIGADGKYSDPTIVHRVDYGVPIRGGSTQTTHYPAFLTFAATFRTALLRGYASKGRMYAPIQPPMQSASGSSTITTTQTTQLATMYESLLSLFANHANPARIFVPSIMSNHAAESNPITSIAVGSRLDSQRRRKNEIPQVYTAVNFVP